MEPDYSAKIVEYVNNNPGTGWLNVISYLQEQFRVDYKTAMKKVGAAVIDARIVREERRNVQYLSAHTCTFEAYLFPL